MVSVPLTMTEPCLAAHHLSIWSGRRVVIKDLSFRAAAGRMLWLIGENGAGKSSLMRALALRTEARGTIEAFPVLRDTAVSYYAPAMGVPRFVTVEAWISWNHHLMQDRPVELPDDDSLVPPVKPAALMTRLSTGEAKRLLLWSLLRVQTPFTFLDEPYEHLSPTAKTRLTEILAQRSQSSVVVVATNQDVPDIGQSETLVIE
jgi:ABC-type transport system involved in cytochrome c biogenesis ATPase subunit